MTINDFLASQVIKVHNGLSIADGFEDAINRYCVSVGTKMKNRIVNSYHNTISLVLLTDDGEHTEIEIVMYNVNYEHKEVMGTINGTTSVIKFVWE